MPAPSRAEDLNQLIQELLRKNPAILAARRMVDAKRAMVLPARTLPEPSLSFETMGNLIPPTLMAGDPSSARVLSFTQELPFPGKLRLQGQIASAEADQEFWKYEETRRELITELKSAYYDYYLAQKLTEVVSRSKDLMQQYAQISEARYKVGEGAQQDVLKSQVEVSRLLDRLALLRRDGDIALARINTLLLRPPGDSLVAIGELPKPRLGFTIDELYRKALENSPQVQMNRKEIDRNELRVALSKKAFYPDFEVGASYYDRRDMPQMYGLMVKAKIPIYFWRKQRPELEAATTELMAQRQQYVNSTSTLYFRLKDPFLKATTDVTLVELYGEAIVPQATLALESSISSYRVGKVDFLSLLSNQNTVIEYEMKYYETLVDYYKTLTMLEALTGEALTP